MLAGQVSGQPVHENHHASCDFEVSHTGLELETTP